MHCTYYEIANVVLAGGFVLSMLIAAVALAVFLLRGR
jgi:hypothetical protein